MHSPLAQRIASFLFSNLSSPFGGVSLSVHTTNAIAESLFLNGRAFSAEADLVSAFEVLLGENSPIPAMRLHTNAAVCGSTRTLYARFLFSSDPSGGWSPSSGSGSSLGPSGGALLKKYLDELMHSCVKLAHKNSELGKSVGGYGCEGHRRKLNESVIVLNGADKGGQNGAEENRENVSMQCMKGVSGGETDYGKISDAGCVGVGGIGQEDCVVGRDHMAVRRLEVLCVLVSELLREYAALEKRRCTSMLAKSLISCGLACFSRESGGVPLSFFKISLLGALRIIVQAAGAKLEGVVEVGVDLLERIVRTDASQKVGARSCDLQFLCDRVVFL